MQGRIKFYREDKGYGFITDLEEAGDDVFFHVSGLMEAVSKDDLVSFEIETGDRGPKAVNIKKKE